MGIVPYIQRGETIPSALAIIIPKTPNFFEPSERKRPWILSFANTETAEPVTIPKTQYQKIYPSCTLK